MIDLTVDGHHSTLTRKSCEILMKRGMYRVQNNKYMFSRDVRLKVGRYHTQLIRANDFFYIQFLGLPPS